MRKAILKSMHLENYRCFHEQPVDIQFGKETRISGKNGSGKSTIKNAFLDVMTGKNADGSQTDNVRPIVNRSEKMDVPVVRELTMDIDGVETSIRKTTKQKRERKFGEMVSIPGSNVNSYEIDGINFTQKKFDEFIAEKLCTPDKLMACCNPNVFLSKLNKSTADARSFLEDLCGFSVERFIEENKDEFGDIKNITRGHKIEQVQKTLNHDRSEQKKKIEKQIATLDYEKSKPIQTVDMTELTSQRKQLQGNISRLDDEEKRLNEAVSSFDNAVREIVDLKSEAEKVRSEANAGLIEKRQVIKSEITGLQSKKREQENNLRFSEMDLKHLNMAIERHTAELKKAQEDWKTYSEKEFSEESIEMIKTEAFDENSLICPTCGQMFPEEQAEKIRADFDRKKSERIKKEEDLRKQFYSLKDKKLQEISYIGNKAATDLKDSKKAKEELEKKIEEIKKSISNLALKIAEKEMELSKIPESVDMSENEEYQFIMNQIAENQSTIEKMNNGSAQREEIRAKRNELIRKCAMIDAQINSAESDKRQHEEQIEQLESQKKEMQAVLVEIERKISVLKNFSIKKNQAISELVNPHFTEFQFEFLDFTQSGEPVEVCKMISDGIEFKDFNHSKKLNAELDMCVGFQEIVGVELPVFLDDTESINAEKIPDVGRQLILLRVIPRKYVDENGVEREVSKDTDLSKVEVTDDGHLRVEVIK